MSRSIGENLKKVIYFFSNYLPLQIWALKFCNHYISKTITARSFKLGQLKEDQSRTNGPIKAHLTIAQVMPRYNHNNEKQEALLYKFCQNICSSTATNSTTKLFFNAINMYVTFNLLILEKQAFF